MSDAKQIEIEVGAHGSQCRVSVDGHPLKVRKFVITGEVGEVTKIELYALKTGGEPYIVKGYLVEGPA